MKKLLNRKVFYIVTPTLSIASITTIGFAGWNIINDGNVDLSIDTSVGSVEENPSLYISNLTVLSKNILFDGDKDDNSGLTQSSNSNEQLCIQFSGTLNGYSSNWSGVRVNLIIEESYRTNFYDLVEKGYIIPPTFEELNTSCSQGSIDSDALSQTIWTNALVASTDRRNFYIGAKFQYGSFFNYMNPTLFFDSGYSNGFKKGNEYTYEERLVILNDLSLLNGASYTLYIDPYLAENTNTITFNADGGNFDSNTTSLVKSNLIDHDVIEMPKVYKSGYKFLYWQNQDNNESYYEKDRVMVEEIFTGSTSKSLQILAIYEDISSSGTISFNTSGISNPASANVTIEVSSNISGLFTQTFSNNSGGTISGVYIGDRIRISNSENVRNFTYSGLSSPNDFGYYEVTSNSFSITFVPKTSVTATISIANISNKVVNNAIVYNLEILGEGSARRYDGNQTSITLGEGDFFRISGIHGVSSISVSNLSLNSNGYYEVGTSNFTITITPQVGYSLTITKSSGNGTSHPQVDVIITNSLGYNSGSFSTGEISSSYTSGLILCKGDKVTLSKGTNCDSVSTSSISVTNSNVSATAKGACLLPTTQILMADNSIKMVKDIKKGELVKVYNHEKGCLDVAPVVFNDYEPKQDVLVIKLEFDTGKHIEIVSEHGFFDVELNKYVYIREDNYLEFVGHKFIRILNDRLVTSKLVKAYTYWKYTEVYSPVTYWHLNIITEEILSMPGGIEGIFNIFDYDKDTLKYNEKQKQEELEKYGTFCYEDFKDLVSEEFYNAFPVPYFKVAIAKRILSEERLQYYIDRYKDK